jgi:inner membrane protein
MGIFGALALLPDADVLGMSMGFEYDGHFGHRGFTHSLAFAAVIAAVAFWVARRWGTRPWLTAVLAFMAVASHGLLDAMTYRTKGVPFFYPLTDARFTFPWRHIPPAPVGTRFLSQRGLEVAAVEFVYFLPITLAALMPPRAAWMRWFRAVSAWFTPAAARQPALVPVRVGAGPASVRRAVTRMVAVVGLTVASMAFANEVLRESRLVSWIERSTEKGVAVSLMDRPEHRQYH